MILAIDTSADETSIAVTKERRILSNVRYSQILTHQKWGGIVPSLAKLAHQEHIEVVLNQSLKRAQLKSVSEVDHIAVTYGPGLAIGLEVGINTAKHLAKKYNKKLIGVNHLEGHIYSCFAQNKNRNPTREFDFPYLVLLVSGGHTELVLFKNHLEYEVIGETIDDAAGEALDKAARILVGAGYPGGPVIEDLAERGNPSYHFFPRPLSTSKDLQFSFSGLKTSFLYYVRNLSEEEKLKNIYNLASAFQQAVVDSLLIKLEKAIKMTGISRIAVGGGVVANRLLRKNIRNLAKKCKGSALFPPFTSLYGDNAAMIGVAAYYKAQKGLFVKDFDKLDREPRLHL